LRGARWKVGGGTRDFAMNNSSKDNEAERPTEDDIAREKLGPRGVPGADDPRRIPPTREKKTPKSGEFDGHVA
jgi:hypothetical protein